MKEIKFKDIAKEWKNTLADTGIFIYYNVMQAYSWIEKKSVEIYRNTPWKKLYPSFTLMALCIVCVVWVSCSISYKNNINSISSENALLQNKLDSITCEMEMDKIKAKTGECAMYSHKDSKSTMTQDSLASLLKELNAWYPDIIMAQIECESANGKSDVAKNANNIAGMKIANSRKTTQIKGKNYKGYGVYNNWESCVIDRILWDYSMFKGKKPTRQQYVNMLNKRYAEKRTYGDTMNKNGEKFRKLFNHA